MISARDATDVASVARSSEKDAVRSKFSDIFQVDKSCDSFPIYDINDISNDISVAGRLSAPEHVRFFESIGAPEHVVETLRYGHKPVLIGEVPQLSLLQT